MLSLLQLLLLLSLLIFHFNHHLHNYYLFFCHSVLEKESAKIKAKLRKVSGDGKEGKAGTSTAVAEKEAKNEKTPAKKTAQKGTKTMETKPISAKKVPRDGPKPGGLNVES